MKTASVFDKEFKAYGKVLEGFDTTELLTAMDKDNLILSSGVNEAGPNLDAILLSNTNTNDNTLNTSPAAASAGQDADTQSADKNGKKIYLGAASVAAGGVALAFGT